MLYKSSQDNINIRLPKGSLNRVHHISIKVGNMRVSRRFYGEILGLQEISADKLPKQICNLVEENKVSIFHIPDGSLLNLFWEPNNRSHNAKSQYSFVHAEISNHLAFEINSQLFVQVIEVLRNNKIKFDYGIDSFTGQAVYCYDPDGFLIEIRYDHMKVPKPDGV